MKKCIVIISVLFSLSVNAQNYHPFPDTTAIWHSVGMNSFSYAHYTFNFGINGDTLINSHKYSKIYRTPDSLFSSNLVYIGALRENEDKQVLLKLPADSEFVLYDFDLNVGDSIFYPLGYALCGNGWGLSTSNSYRVVTSIDSILLYNNEYRKRWILTCDIFLGDQWVEGIGSIEWFGLLNPLVGDITLCGDGYYFGCFVELNEILFFDSTVCNYCMGDYLLNVSTYPGDNQQIDFFYNPSDKTVTINSNRDPFNYSISIINVVGEIMNCYNSITTRTYSINVATLPKGMYVFRISEHEDNIATGKFVVY
ncbi:MAG: T9SS type A sorting domain-containing protein [Bacteroidetes bacterium]|nr:T9SS type A sorting domain-containing protein [Bacteroidota bacterium]